MGRPAGYGASEPLSLETGLGGIETLLLLHPQSSLTSSSEADWITHRADPECGEEEHGVSMLVAICTKDYNGTALRGVFVPTPN